MEKVVKHDPNDDEDKLRDLFGNGSSPREAASEQEFRLQSTSEVRWVSKIFSSESICSLHTHA